MFPFSYVAVKNVSLKPVLRIRPDPGPVFLGPPDPDP